MTGASLQMLIAFSHGPISHPNGSNSTILDQLMPIEFYANPVRPQQRLGCRTIAGRSIQELTESEPATS